MKLVFQFVAEHTVGSALIRWFTQSRFSHVDVVLPDGRLLGARLWGGVRIRPPDYIKRLARVERVEVDLWGTQKALAFCTSQIGAGYDWRAILAFVTGVRKKSWRTPGAWFCSELAARVLEIAGDFKFGVETVHISPGALYLATSPVEHAFW